MKQWAKYLGGSVATYLVVAACGAEPATDGVTASADGAVGAFDGASGEHVTDEQNDGTGGTGAADSREQDAGLFDRFVAAVDLFVDSAAEPVGEVQAQAADERPASTTCDNYTAEVSFPGATDREMESVYAIIYYESPPSGYRYPDGITKVVEHTKGVAGTRVVVSCYEDGAPVTFVLL